MAAEVKYNKLEIDYPLSDELNEVIDCFMEDINNGGTSEDCYRSEILFWLKNDRFFQHKLTDEQYEELKDYYVNCGIYEV